MPFLSAAPVAQTVDPYQWAKFDGFSCGGGSAYEQHVDLLASQLFDYQIDGVFRAAEMPDDGALAGFCFWHMRALLNSYPDDIPYIAVIAVSADFRGKKLPSGLSVGDFLLSDALANIENTCCGAGDPMPAVWALIDKGNGASQKLFERYEFEALPDDAGLDPLGVAVRGEDAVVMPS